MPLVWRIKERIQEEGSRIDPDFTKMGLSLALTSCITRSTVRLRFYSYCHYFIFSGQGEILGNGAGMKGRIKPFPGNKYSEAQSFDYFMDRELYAHIVVIIFPHGTD